MGLPDGLFTLGLTHFGLLIPLGHDILECSSHNGPLELLRPLGALFGGFFLNTLPVLTPVEHSPSHLTRIPLQQVSAMTAAIQKFEDLAIGLDQSPATARINLVATVRAEFDPGKHILVLVSFDNLHLNRLEIDKEKRAGNLLHFGVKNGKEKEQLLCLQLHHVIWNLGKLTMILQIL